MSPSRIQKSRCTNPECRYRLFEVVRGDSRHEICPQCGHLITQCDHHTTMEHDAPGHGDHGDHGGHGGHGDHGDHGEHSLQQIAL